MKAEIRLDSIEKVSFSLQGPSHMVLEGFMRGHQLEDLMNQWWEYGGEQLFTKYFLREGYDLIKRPDEAC